MQFVAMLTMLSDHMGIIFFKNELIWRIIGRLAFPIYAYCIVVGYKHTRDLKKYMLRLLLIAAISQLPFMLALGIMGFNAVATLLVCIVTLYLLDKWKWLVIPVITGLAVMLEVLNFDYGLYGLILVLIFRYTKGGYMVLSHLLLNIIFVFYKGWVTEFFSIIATLFIVYAPWLYKAADNIQIPRWLWRSFYPAHLTVLGVIFLIIRES
ncbi:conjugal transfer protein TraX [Paenibacillus psychroresistens]|uniref:Conjugal transfer protein TraX n=1 Tax=Paenibacillus psychroresistens TaxID=1778678 RepID=A0A6B8RC83_9BACL|nr:TraX family protein [Paenibacillus psychroresistens]QGQ93929.1 conjugal transfer protein TraX [Paenibacillus psychroresistens]